MNNKNLPWIIGGALVAWYLWNRSKKPATPAAQPELLAVENGSSQQAQAATFTPDYTPEQKILQEAFNQC
jgi:hypothetical protein